MNLFSLTLTNFRCFGPDTTSVNLEQGLTCLVGNNASGKTAVFQALNRLFGVGAANRRVLKEDFHVQPQVQGLVSGCTLILDVVFGFPELEMQNVDEKAHAIPEFFNQMVVSELGTAPKVRMQLRATWLDDGTPEGSIEEELRWVNSLENDFEWDDCYKVQASERATIQFIYVPAKRDASTQIAALLKSRLWRAAKWSEELKNNSEQGSCAIQSEFEQEAPAQLINQLVQEKWNALNASTTYTKPKIRLLENSFEQLINQAEFVFSPDEAGGERSVSALSDGQRSLFHLALTASTLEAERKAVQNAEAFHTDKLLQVHLTLLAIEEPENNLSPFFLARIMQQANEIAALEGAQVLVSSHSPAIMSRVEPSQVRYLRLDSVTNTSSIKPLTLPADQSEANKYVRLAVRSYPEMYFARFVILGEGDSELLVIPKIAEAMGVLLDPSFVPVVPLGGRYVEHFWRLLNDLEIPHATLLDLDLGRQHGGVKLLQEQLKRLTDFGHDLETFPSLCEDIELLANPEAYLPILEKEGLFFSYSIDIDFSMLESFPEAYHALAVRGPKLDAESLATAKSAVLKKGGNPDLYHAYESEVFAWYRYLFLGRSKPDGHLSVLSQLSHEDIRNSAPQELKNLITYVVQKLDL